MGTARPEMAAPSLSMALAATLVALVAFLAMAAPAVASWRGDRLLDPRLLSRWSFSTGIGAQVPLGVSSQPVTDDKGGYTGTLRLAQRLTCCFGAGAGPNMSAVPGVPGVPGGDGDGALDANWGSRGVNDCTDGSGPAGERNSNYVDFHGVNNGNIHNFLPSGQSFTIEAWFKTREGAGNGVGAVPDAGYVWLNKNSAPVYQICGYGSSYDTTLASWRSVSITPSKSYDLRILRNTDGTGMVRFQFAGAVAAYNQAPTPNTWHQVVGVRDAGSIRLYYDGKLVATASAPGPLSSYGNGRFGLAGYNYQGNAGPFPGVIDEVSVLSGALTPGEICDSYMGGTGQGTGWSGYCRANRLRPSLHYDSGETYRPLDVDAFFGERDDQAQPLHGVCTATACDQLESAADLPAADPESYIDIAGDGTADSYHSPYGDCTAGGLRDCDSGPRSAMYYWQTSQPGTSSYYHDYWMFYRYNDWPFFSPIEHSDHEGDWENVSVAGLGPDGDVFDFASFSQHGHWYSYLRENLSCDGLGPGTCDTPTNPNSTRLDVYVSRGSHANYPDECDESVEEFCPRNDTDLVSDGSRDGSSTWGNDSSASALRALPSPAEASHWTAWPGSWGAPQDETPKGPAHGGNGSHFYAPWEGECADDNQNCPTAGTSRKRRAANLRRNDRCGTWFGGGVAAVACAPARLRSAVAHRRLDADGAVRLRVSRIRRDGDTHAASAPGIAQVVGDPLAPGDVVRLRGRRPAGARLLVRAATRRELLTAVFRLPAAGGRIAVRVRGRRGRPVLLAARPGGPRLRPSSVDRLTLRRGPAPSVRLSRVDDRSVALRYRSSGSYAITDVTTSRGGGQLHERYLSPSPRRVRRVTLPVEPTARYVRFVSVRRDGSRSPVAIVAIPGR